MNNTFALEESKIKRMPLLLIIITLFLLALPYLGLYLGIDFNSKPYRKNSETFLLESNVREYFRQALLQWSGFSLAAVTSLLAFVRYRLSKDKIALVIGSFILFTGLIDAGHTIFFDGFTNSINEKNNFDALIWAFSNTVGGLILVVGLLFLVNLPHKKKQKSNSVLYFCVFLLLITLLSTYSLFKLINSPSMWAHGTYIERPYEILSIIVYSCLNLFVYPKTFKKHPSILSHCIFYIGVAQIFMGLYLLFFPHSAYYVVYFLKLVAYFIPCSCLIIDYVYTYSSILKAQKTLAVQQEELKYKTSHDTLTNLYNRREFEYLLDKSVANALRNNSSLALLLIDLDNFKSTNDTYGHMHGDELLKQFSERLVVLIRKGDLLARVGGDEFTLISLNIKSPSSARRLAQRILNELNSPYLINGKFITVTVSIGISIFPADGCNSEKLLIKADLAMYKAKNSGKNTYQFYTEELSYLQHRESEIEAHLRKALQNDEFELHFQPKYHLVNNKIIGAEILLRWSNELLGCPSPNEFIPVAEHSGLIIDIGNWVLKKTCEQIVAWKKQYPNTDLSFSINISPIQLANGQFLTVIKKIFTELEYTANNLEFEITENILIEGESEEISSVLNSISKLGIKISLDDFGKGYSSLNRLKTLPIDTLKIDKYFISDIHNEKDKVVIVDIIIKLAYELGMNIIAEGIETPSQLKYLIEKECFYGQGFLLSQPVSTETFEKLAFTKEEH